MPMRRLTFAVMTLVLSAAALAAQQRTQGDLQPGALAPDFTLDLRGGGAPVTLSSFRGKSPVALVFGSYT